MFTPIGTRVIVLTDHVKSFAEEVKTLRIAPYLASDYERDTAYSESGSHLRHTLVHWHELCCSGHFIATSTRLLPLCQTLPQVLLHSDELISSLHDAILKSSENSIEAVLHALVALSNDLSADFAEYFPSSVAVICHYLDTAHLEVQHIETIFRALCTICKVLHRTGKVGVVHILHAMRVLHIHNKSYVRKLAAQATAHVLRSSNEDDISTAIQVSLQDCSVDGEYISAQCVDAAALLACFVAIGHKHGLHSKAPIVFHSLFRPCTEAAFNTDFLVTVIDNVALAIRATLRADALHDMWSCLVDALKTHQQGRRAHDQHSLLLAQIIGSFTSNNSSLPIADEDGPCLVSLLRNCFVMTPPRGFNRKHFARIMATLFIGLVSQNVLLNMTFFQSRDEWRQFVSLLDINTLVSMLDEITRRVSAGCEVTRAQCKAIMRHLTVHVLLRGVESSLALGRLFRKLSDIGIFMENMSSEDIRTIQSMLECNLKLEEVSLVFAAVYATPHVLPYEEFEQIGCSIFSYVQDIDVTEHKAEVAARQKRFSLMYALVEAEICFKQHNRASTSIFGLDVANFALTQDDLPPPLISKIMRLLCFYSDARERIYMHMNRTRLYQSVNSVYREERIASMILLQRLDLDYDSKELNITDTFLYLNSFNTQNGNMLEYSRKGINLLQTLHRQVVDFGFEGKLLALNLAMGTLNMRFQPVWAPLLELISILANDTPKLLNVLLAQLWHAKDDVLKTNIHQDTTSLHEGVASVMVAQADSIDPMRRLQLFLSAVAKCSSMIDHELVQTLFLDVIALSHKKCFHSTEKKFHSINSELLDLLYDALAGSRDTQGNRAPKIHPKLMDVLRVILSDEDSTLASKSLRCISVLSGNLPEYWITRMSLLTAPNTLKEGLASITFENEGNSLNMMQVCLREREQVVDILVLILSKYVRIRKTSYKPHRLLTMRWLSNLSSREVTPIIYAILDPFERIWMSFDNKELIQRLRESRKGHSDTDTVALLSRLHDAQRTMPKHVYVHLDWIVPVVVDIFNEASVKLNDMSCVASANTARLKGLRTKAFHFLTTCADVMSLSTFKQFWYQSLTSLEIASRTVTEESHRSTVHPLLSLLALMVESAELLELLEHDGAVLLENCVDVLWHRKASTVCQQATRDILHTLVSRAHLSEAPSQSAIHVLQNFSCTALNALKEHWLINSLKTSKLEGLNIATEVRLLKQIGEIKNESMWSETLFEELVRCITSSKVQNNYVAWLTVLSELLDFPKKTMDEKLAKTYVESLSPLFARVCDRQARTLLLDIVEKLDEGNSLSDEICMLRSLHAFAKGHLEDVDYTVRLGVYEELGEYLNQQKRFHDVFVHNALFDVRQTDVIIQSAAKSFLCDCLHALKQSSHMVQCTNVHDILLPGLRHLLKSKDASIRNQGLQIFRVAVKTQHVKTLHHLWSENEDIDVFVNLSHIQPHRRLRAINRLCSADSMRLVDPGIFFSNLWPLLTNMLEDPNPDVTMAAASGIGTVCQILDTELWLRQMQRFLTRAKGSNTPNQYLRAVVFMVETFRKSSSFHNDKDNCGSHLKTVDYVSAIDTIKYVILPLAESLILSKVGHVISRGPTSDGAQITPNAVWCTVSILRLLDHDASEAGLMHTLKIVLDHIAHFSENVRARAMTALGAISREVGDRHLLIIIRMLRSRLVRSSNWRVLNKAVCVVLSKCETFPQDVLLPLLDELLPSLESSIFGMARDHVEARNKSRVFQKDIVRYAYDIIEILVSVAHEPEELLALVRSLFKILPEQPDKRNRASFCAIMNALEVGIVRNNQIKSVKMLLLAGSLIEESMMVHEETTGAQVDKVALQREYSLIVQQFAIKLLSNSLKKTLKNEPGYVQTIDGVAALSRMVDLMVRCMSSTSQQVKLYATSLLAKLLSLKKNLSSLDHSHIIKQMTQALKSCRSPRDKLAQHCLEVLAKVVTLHGADALTSTQLNETLSFAFESLCEESAELSSTFAFLEALMARRVLTAKVYSLIERLLKMITCGGSAHLRTLSSRACVRFVLTYPIGERQMDRIIQTLSSSLNYAHADGRLSALRTVQDVVSSLPQDALNGHAATFFLPLVLRMARDDDMESCELACTCVARIFDRISVDKAVELLKCAEIWLTQQNSLRKAAYQVILIGFSCYPTETYGLFVKLELVFMSDLPRLLNKERSALYWSHIYCLIKCLEAVVQYRIGTCRPFTNATDICTIELMPDMIMHEHLWVQSAAVRLLKVYVSVDRDHNQKLTTHIFTFKDTKVLSDSLMLHFERLSCTNTCDDLTLECVFYCLSKFSETLVSTREGTLHLESLLARCCKAIEVTRAHNICDTILRWVAGIITHTADMPDVSSVLCHHVVLLCGVVNARSSSESSQNLAREILCMLQHLLPQNALLDVLNQAQQMKNHVR